MDDHDRDVFFHIGKLMDKERQYAQLATRAALTDEQLVEMQQIEKYLDQCWDLLRQRRARRLAGLDPADARLPDEAISERFPQ